VPKSYHLIEELAKPESITRCRRKIQNDEERLLPTKQEIRERRKVKQSVYKEIYGIRENRPSIYDKQVVL